MIMNEAERLSKAIRFRPVRLKSLGEPAIKHRQLATPGEQKPKQKPL